MKPVGSIDMCRATSLADDPEAPLNFNIITPHRTFNFKASNDYDKAMWVEALGQKIDYSQNIEGYLWKFSSGRWQQKWFMCQGGELCYSKNIKVRVACKVISPHSAPHVVISLVLSAVARAQNHRVNRSLCCKGTG